jgi:hypothetical protein
MVGGAKFQQTVLDWSKQSTQLCMTVMTVILVIWITFADKLPVNIRWQLSTTVGRLLLLLLLFIVNMLCGWMMTLLFAVAIALTWAARPMFKPIGVSDEPQQEEGFANIKKTKASTHKWFVETVLHENPKKIVEDRVDTMAVQQDGSDVAGRTSR